MDANVRREALRVAAKLAFAGAAVACGGKLAIENIVPDAALDALGTIDAADEPAPTCAVSKDAAFDPDLTACCNVMIASALDAGAIDAANTAQKSCCAYLDDYATYSADGSSAIANSCCYLFHSGTAFCNPWGPPTPPAMV